MGRRGLHIRRMKRYERLAAWQPCHALALSVYRATEQSPSSERYGITGQLRRAALSAPTNITEGAAKRGKSEFRRFLAHSIGSLSEVGYLLLVARDLELLSLDAWSTLEQERDAAARVTYLLYRSLSPDHSRPP